MFRPDRRMFRAALVSLSCKVPQPSHTHALTRRCFTPLGPPSALHSEHIWVLYRSFVSTKHAPCLLIRLGYTWIRPRSGMWDGGRDCGRAAGISRGGACG